MQRRSVIAALLCLVFWQPTESFAELEERSCRMLHELLPAAFGQCATLNVPLDYANPDGASIDLYVARIPALTANPAPDPLVLINGGPGGSTVDLYLQLRAAFEPILRQRDIILLDQRGTGRSLSGLDCELPEGFDLTTATPQEIQAGVASCIAEFDHDPRFFTTSVAVTDLDRLREALGVDAWNLYGVSYGTRVAQHYLRRYGDRVRTMILDGVVPAELTLGPSIAPDAQNALNAIFARCAESPACAERFRDLPQHFAELLARFSNDSIEVVINDSVTGEPKSMLLEASHLQGAIRFMSYNDATVALLPLTLETAYQGNYLPLAAQADLQIEGVAESIGFAMHNSVICTEDVPFFGAAAVTATIPAPYLGSLITDGLRTICNNWPVGVMDDDFKEPVVSDRPVLVLSGQHDPVTPPENGERIIAAGLENARHIIGRAQGHGLASVGCVPRLMRSFVEAGSAADLDPSCLDDEPPMPFFLNFQGPGP